MAVLKPSVISGEMTQLQDTDKKFPAMTEHEAIQQSLVKQFDALKNNAEKAMAQLCPDDYLKEPAPGSNCIAVICRHMSGNMRSRFTHFHTEDGEKPWRNRDQEFEKPEPGWPSEEAGKKWDEGWNLITAAINAVPEGGFNATVTIRHEPHTVIDAINRQLAHYASHVGQIVYIAKMIKGENWKPLSIPKNESDKFNQEMARKFGH